jgi:hypothetical protein
MKRLDYTFDNRTRHISFELTDDDAFHAAIHTTRMQEWTGPLIMNVLSGVDWDKVQRNFPFYSFRCSDCDYHGSDYNDAGTLRHPKQ